MIMKTWICNKCGAPKIDFGDSKREQIFQVSDYAVPCHHEFIESSVMYEVIDRRLECGQILSRLDDVEGLARFMGELNGDYEVLHEIYKTEAQAVINYIKGV